MWQSVLNQISQWMTPYFSEISLTIMATIMVVYGDVLNKHIKLWLKPYHFIIRTLLFVLVCAFGYGLLLVLTTPLIKQLILAFPYLYRGVAVIAIFLVLGYLADHRRYI
ncbi:DUF3392 domain-containing protein [Paraglaciecola aestuariivivens]